MSVGQWFHLLLRGFLCWTEKHSTTLSGQHHAWTEWLCASVSQLLRGVGL